MKAGKAYFIMEKDVVKGALLRCYAGLSGSIESLWKKLGIIKYKGMVWEYIGYLNSVQGLYENSIDNFKHSIRYYELASTDVVFYMVIGIWQEAIFRYIIMIVQVGMLKKGLC